MPRRLTVVAILGAFALAVPAPAGATTAETDCAGGAGGAATDPGSFTSFWTRYGPGFTGGDQAVSAGLPDGRTACVFGDTILGTVRPDGTRAPNQPVVHHTVAIQSGACVTKYHAGTTAAPRSLLTPPGSTHWYWPAHATANGGRLQVVLTELQAPTRASAAGSRPATRSPTSHFPT